MQSFKIITYVILFKNTKAVNLTALLFFDACVFFFHDEKNLIVSGENNTFF